MWSCSSANGIFVRLTSDAPYMEMLLMSMKCSIVSVWSHTFVLHPVQISVFTIYLILHGVCKFLFLYSVQLLFL